MKYEIKRRKTEKKYKNKQEKMEQVRCDHCDKPKPKEELFAGAHNSKGMNLCLGCSELCSVCTNRVFHGNTYECFNCNALTCYFCQETEEINLDDSDDEVEVPDSIYPNTYIRYHRDRDGFDDCTIYKRVCLKCRYKTNNPRVRFRPHNPPLKIIDRKNKCCPKCVFTGYDMGYIWKNGVCACKTTPIREHLLNVCKAQGYDYQVVIDEFDKKQEDKMKKVDDDNLKQFGFNRHTWKYLEPNLNDHPIDSYLHIFQYLEVWDLWTVRKISRNAHKAVDKLNSILLIQNPKHKYDWDLVVRNFISQLTEQYCHECIQEKCHEYGCYIDESIKIKDYTFYPSVGYSDEFLCEKCFVCDNTIHEKCYYNSDSKIYECPKCLTHICENCFYQTCKECNKEICDTCMHINGKHCIECYNKLLDEGKIKPYIPPPPRRPRQKQCRKNKRTKKKKVILEDEWEDENRSEA